MSRIWVLTIVGILLATATHAQVPLVQHTLILMEENQDFSCVIGNTSMPYLNQLAADYALAASYYANQHPSISNYFLLTTGLPIYKGRFGDFRTEPVSEDNVIRELKKNGKTWRAYVEGIPNPGYMGGNIERTGYVKRHNPLAYFANDISPDERVNLAPFSQFSDDLAHDKLPNYAFIVPNLYDDGHNAASENGRNEGHASCGEASSSKRVDSWLRAVLEPLLNSKTFKDSGLLIITYDEASADDDSDGAGHWGGGRVPFVIVSSKVKKGYRSVTLYHHESTLRLMLEALGLDRNSWPGGAKDAPSMAEFFGK